MADKKDEQAAQQQADLQAAQEKPVKVEIVASQPHIPGDNSGIDEAEREGGLYIVDDQKVDANGDPLNKREAEAALDRQSPTATPTAANAASTPTPPARDASKKDSK